MAALDHTFVPKPLGSRLCNKKSISNLVVLANTRVWKDYIGTLRALEVLES